MAGHQQPERQVKVQKENSSGTGRSERLPVPFCSSIGNSSGFPIEEKTIITLRRERNMSLKRPAAGGESCKAGFFVLLQEDPVTIKRESVFLIE